MNRAVCELIKSEKIGQDEWLLLVPAHQKRVTDTWPQMYDTPFPWAPAVGTIEPAAAAGAPRAPAAADEAAAATADAADDTAVARGTTKRKLEAVVDLLLQRVDELADDAEPPRTKAKIIDVVDSPPPEVDHTRGKLLAQRLTTIANRAETLNYGPRTKAVISRIHNGEVALDIPADDSEESTYKAAFAFQARHLSALLAGRARDLPTPLSADLIAHAAQEYYVDHAELTSALERILFTGATIVTILHDPEARTVPISEIMRLLTENGYLTGVRHNAYRLLLLQAQQYGYAGATPAAPSAPTVPPRPPRNPDRGNASFRTAPGQGASLTMSVITIQKGNSVWEGKEIDLCQLCGNATARGNNHSESECPLLHDQLTDHLGNSATIFGCKFPYGHPGPIRFFAPLNGKASEKIPLLYQPKWGTEQRVAADEWATYVATAKENIRQEDRKEYDLWVSGAKTPQFRSRVPPNKKSGGAGRRQ